MKYVITRYFVAFTKVPPRNYNCDTLPEAMARAKELEALTQTSRITISVLLYDTGQIKR